MTGNCSRQDQYPDDAAPLTDTAIGVGAADGTEILPDAIRNVDTPLAWSQSQDADDDSIGRSSWAMWPAYVVAATVVSIGIAAAVVIIVIGQNRQAPIATPSTSPSAAVQSQAAQPVAVSPTSTPPPVVAAPPLDGTYRVDFETSKETLNGRLAPGDLSNDSSLWYAFRSVCTPAGCIATGTLLDSKNLQAAATPVTNFVLHWINGRWQADDRTDQLVCYTNGDYQERHRTSIDTMVFVPQPGGRFSGTDTWTIRSNECGDSGDTRVVPITATRTGAPPVGLVADPPTG
jgi:hypothetical protein